MTTKTKLLIGLVVVSCLALIAASIWTNDSLVSISGGALLTYLASRAKNSRDADLQSLREKTEQTQKAGREALAAADDALQKMERLEKTSEEASSSPEELTSKGNELFS